MNTATLEQITVADVEAYVIDANAEAAESFTVLPCGCRVRNSQV